MEDKFTAVSYSKNLFEEQVNLKNDIDKFNEFTRRKTPIKKMRKREEKPLTNEKIDRPFERRQKFLYGFEDEIFAIGQQTQ